MEQALSMNMDELFTLAHMHGHTVYIENATGAIVDEKYYLNFQAIADSCTNGFNHNNF